MSTPNPFEIGDTIRGFATGEVVFQRYELKKILGRGGMGVVWLAWDQKLEEKVALKFLPETVRMDQSALKDLVRETKRSRELTHPNIVRIHDLVEDDSSAAIVMEYVDGVTLEGKRHEDPDGVVDPELLERVLPQISEALDYSHNQAKIVHRDIKAANVMLTKNGQVKVADFGVARSLTDTQSRMTAVGASAGTLAYMSPQQLMGERPQSGDDIYSLGAMIHELLVGAPPFHSGDIATQVQYKRPPGVNSEREHLGLEPLDEKWEILVSRCLEKDPAERLPSGAQMLALLENPSAVVTAQITASENLTEQAEVSSSEPKAKSPLFLGAVICLVIGAISIALWQPWKTDEEKEAQQAKEELRREGPEAGESREFEIAPGVKVAFRWCPAGTFMMGSPAGEVDRDNAETQHKVILSKGFWLAETECTQAQWKAVMGTTIEQQRDKGDKSWSLSGKGANHPMYFVNWDEIQSYLRKLRLPVGLKASLPTEAQWEYACRAGSHGAYGGTENLAEMGWYSSNSNGTIHPVGEKKANAWGLYDMHGNVWEWCSDWYGDYRGGRQTDPTGAKDGQFRVLRGGSWYDVAWSSRSAFRSWYRPGGRSRNLGFRLSLQVASQ